MPVNYKQIQSQIVGYAAKAQRWQQDLNSILDHGLEVIHLTAESQDALTARVAAAFCANPNLRCALPTGEKIDSTFPLPDNHPEVTVIAADGSQVIPSRHRQVEFGVINISTVAMRFGSGNAPKVKVTSKLLDLDLLLSDPETASEGYIALLRDVDERSVLAQETVNELAPVITLTDGGLELFREPRVTALYTRKLQEYLHVMEDLRDTGAITAAYVDKPGSGLVMEMLSIASAANGEHSGTERNKGFPDRLLFSRILTQPGARSALFQILSSNAALFTGDLALHFFYLNVSRTDKPYIVRVEVPAWVAYDCAKMDLLHSGLIDQCWQLARPYPYVLHRAHEEAVVTFDDSSKVEQMIIAQLLKDGVVIGDGSNKQNLKDQPGKARYGK